MISTLKITFTVLALVIAGQSFGQQWFNSPEDTRNAREHIKALKDGVLLVRLKSDRKKITALQESLESASDPKDIQYFEKQLTKTVTNKDAYIQDVVKGVDAAYKFSEYAFFYDYDTKTALKEGKKIFASDLTTPVTIDKGKPTYVLTLGQTPIQSVDAYMILTGDLNLIPSPFPNKVVNSIFIWRIDRYIGKLDKKLHDYHTLVEAGVK